MKRYAQLGSVSSGTLRTKDLLSAFANTLEDLVDEYVALAQEARNVDPDSEVAAFVLDDLFNTLQQFAPPYCYFGVHEGDAADFGFWINEYALADAEANGYLVRSEDPPADSHVKAWLRVDGNRTTLYMRDNGGWYAVWSV